MASRETTLAEFNTAFNRHDVDAMMSLMTDDCVFENTSPAPDGTRYVGQSAVRAFWEAFFESSPHARIDVESELLADDGAAQLWTYTWIDLQGVAGHVRGVDVFRFRDDRICEKLSYVKG